MIIQNQKPHSKTKQEKNKNKRNTKRLFYEATNLTRTCFLTILNSYGVIKI